jgi:hypothetical protein
MLRIVGVQRNDNPEREFVLLQNQGSMRISLRGYVLMSEQAIESGSLYATSHVFQDDIQIMPSAYVLLFTGTGENRWTRTKEGCNVYQTYAGQDRAIWNRLEGALHIMHAHHIFVERGEHLAMRR